MGSSQLYSLSWGEFGTSLVSAVQLLRCHGDLVDVTLAAGGRSFPAHKIVLSAASPFLLDLLKSTPCQHPVVMLAGVTAHDLEALLEFVYRGEVSVDPNQLPSLLQAAHCLNIQGLAPGTLNAETMYSLHKLDDMHPSPASHEALSRDVINSFLPIRRKRKTKRRESTGNASSTGSSGSKWARHDSLSADSENQPANHHQNSSHSSHIPESDVLSNPDTRKNDDGESSNQSADETEIGASGFTGEVVTNHSFNMAKFIGSRVSAAQREIHKVQVQSEVVNTGLVQHIQGSFIQHSDDSGTAFNGVIGHLNTGVSPASGSGGTKIRGASDQPGACPLCGALLRQARNLRRHLLTSCKYRMSVGPGGGPGVGVGVGAAYSQQPSALEPEVQLQQPATFASLLPVALPQPGRPSSPLRPLSLQQQQSTSQSQAQEDTPMRTVLLHVQHSHQSSQPLLPLPPEERSVQLPLPVPLLAPLHLHHSPQQRRQETACEQIVCKVSPVPSPSPGPSAPCADLVSPAAVECRRVAGTPPVAQQSQQ
ncbi:transcription factor GAGA-like [Schistocerca cancellata]|uniref:transcription factor GAGA-like n=1 Tax=Schistocerca cancellata TaxID=274614 RepID=UPI0021187705|nr:transcription factor GAGA-like [Schistocerca cancellata]